MNTFSKKLPTIESLRNDLRIVMSEQKLTQQSVEAISGVPQSTISSFLQGKRGLSAQSMLLLWPIVYGNENQSQEDSQ